MNKNKGRIIRFNRDITINAATSIIAAILLYLIISVLVAANKEPKTTYKVNKTNVSNNIVLNGLIVRDEQILSTDASGYVCYFVRDGEKIKKSSPVCSIDQYGQIYDVVNNIDNYTDILTEDDYNDIRSLISLYKISYNDTDFYSSYNFETNVNNKVLELTGEILMQQANQEAGSGLTSVVSPVSGIVTYYVDGFEDYNIENISKDDFDKSSYKKTTLKTGDVITSNSSVVKVIPSENWNIVAPITTEEIAAISESEYIRFTLNNSNYIIKMPYTIINAADGTYINIKLSKYMSNYISERYIDIEIIREEDTGLKVPVSSLVEKEVFKIPISYLSGGGNQNYTNRLNIQMRNSSGELIVTQIVPTIYTSDDEFCYVDPVSFTDSDVLFNIETNETLPVSLVTKDIITGVYSANRGIAEFVMVDIVKTVDEFALVKSDGGLKVYDNIILDSETVKENEIIY